MSIAAVPPGTVGGGGRGVEAVAGAGAARAGAVGPRAGHSHHHQKQYGPRAHGGLGGSAQQQRPGGSVCVAGQMTAKPSSSRVLEVEETDASVVEMRHTGQL